MSCACGPRERHSRSPRLRALPVIVLLMTCTSGSAAEAGQPPATLEPTLLLGPVGLFPAFTLRDVGIDSNVFNEPDDPKEDFTATAEPALKAVTPVGPAQLTGSAAIGLVYYADYKSQESVNRLFEARFDWTGSRLRPFVAGSYDHSRQRAGFEIDARVLRKNAAVSSGAEFTLTGITSLTGSYRRVVQKYGDQEEFLGAALAEQLDQTTDVASAGARFAFTPLTTVSIETQVQRDRFDMSPIRDADSVRIMPSVEFAPDAIVAGSAGGGYKSFDPTDARVPGFRGFVGFANIGYSMLGMTRFNVEATRDVMYSFDPATPYFLVTSGRLSVAQRVAGPFDLLLVVGQDQLRYQNVESLPEAGRVDRTRTVGGGVGVRLGSSLRLGVIYDFTERVSTQLDVRA